MRRPWLLALIAGLLVGGGMAAWKLMGPEPGSALAEREKLIITAIHQLGGTALVDDKDPDRPVVAVNLTSTDCTDKDLEQLRGLSRLRVLNLAGTRITDAGLQHLATQTQLEELYLLATPITDAGLASLRNLNKLSSLDLSATQITDRGLPYLQALGRLENLSVAETGVTATGISALKKALPALEIRLTTF
jgi:Leucine-rich repeat (LRR) protein